jgi:hypothetical protein
MAHTPGPWGIVFNGDVERIRLNGSTVYQVSDVTDPEFPSGQPRYCLDDLRLMAAAPELLGFLHQIADECKRRLRKGSDSGDLLTLQLCRAAISKAEGRTDEE